ncbi:hypothetical protein CR194_19100 [Salipaludibacillus keqinensis]|uniref:VanZ-like domain-containing protein n=1 Tax=Salipaludibacillus keqinensis TaxID=2045207 RepID=A0A323T933_9BACI|nr:VanZ family protein [Salipaludibacillus keqinensis]PYZ91730.1 hypothetical protein CR194_19100 [Salipaludibacillus keqinensis]
MKFIKFFVINLLPIVIVMSTIFIASSQSSDQQDISPVLDRVSDESSLRGIAASVKERIDGVADRVIALAINHPSIVLVSFTVMAILIAVLFFRLVHSPDSTVKKVLKSIIYSGIMFMFMATAVFAVKSDSVIEVIRNQLSLDQIRTLLTRIDFTYAGSTVNLQSHGVDGLMEFFLRKGAHFFLFALLGFFVFLALFKLTRRSLSSFIIAMIVVIAYAALDEYRQTFIPSRSGLIEDVILDTAGGLFGATMGWLKKLISRSLR